MAQIQKPNALSTRPQSQSGAKVPLSKSMEAYLMAQRDDLAKVAPKFIDPERLCRVAVQTMLVGPNTALLRDAFQKNPHTFLVAVMKLAELGIEPGGQLGYGYLIPRFEKGAEGPVVTAMVGWRGYVMLGFRGGTLKDIAVDVVREHDEYEYVKGYKPRFSHRPCLKKDRGAPLFWYCLANFTQGGRHLEVLDKEKMGKVKAFALADKKNTDFSPWTKWETEMQLKTTVRSAVKYWPLDALSQAALRAEDDGEEEAPRAEANGVRPASELFGRAAPEVSEAELVDEATGEVAMSEEEKRAILAQEVAAATQQGLPLTGGGQP